MIVKGICISDIHFGLSCSERVYEELSMVKDFINKNDLHVIHINGDYFDRKLTFCEPASLIAMQFFYEIRELLKSNSHSESEAEISCAGLIDEWVNGKEEK